MSRPISHHDLGVAELIELSVTRGEGHLLDNGALSVLTGSRSGRSPLDRFFVDESTTTESIVWGTTNQRMTEAKFNYLWEKVELYLNQQEQFISHLHVAQHEEHYLPLKITTQTAWHNLFARNMFVRTDQYNPRNKPCWEMLHACNFVCNTDTDGTRSEGIVAINFAMRRVLIAGLSYAGEIKKAMFSVQNFLLPELGIMPMHCAANVGDDGYTTLFFGLSGTGKTTLSADSTRALIGDDEHGWTTGSVFNLEGGCYAKTINLNKTNEPIIWNAIRFGAITENVFVNNSTQRTADFDNTSITENGRCSYPLEHVPKRKIENCSGEPKYIIFLTCDVNGVLPPVSLLSKEAAAYHFLTGYTARVSSTEIDTDKGISPTFSPCFGAPFMPRKAEVYANLLLKRIEKFGSEVFLVNTGWYGGFGGPNGNGNRFPIPVTRSIVSAIVNGTLSNVDTKYLKTLNLYIPVSVPGVENRYLNPKTTWMNAKEYQAQAEKLMKMFAKNMQKFQVLDSILMAGPQPKLSV
ncbi:MAG: phosphoenolpyruvate carboxykinase (ATP) [Porticoccaceae bacterium]|nr:phosphoenolpyruvate carboxykinase (ATP) [Porticoccaceae bacterium]|tara:strand:- start:30916 stop:32478 length:1563 start_codon:yes stop_codon:yes gene_type:complete